MQHMWPAVGINTKEVIAKIVIGADIDFATTGIDFRIVWLGRRLRYCLRVQRRQQREYHRRKPSGVPCVPYPPVPAHCIIQIANGFGGKFNGASQAPQPVFDKFLKRLLMRVRDYEAIKLVRAG